MANTFRKFMKMLQEAAEKETAAKLAERIETGTDETAEEFRQIIAKRPSAELKSFGFLDRFENAIMDCHPMDEESESVFVNSLQLLKKRGADEAAFFHIFKALAQQSMTPCVFNVLNEIASKRKLTSESGARKLLYWALSELELKSGYDNDLDAKTLAGFFKSVLKD